MRKRWLRTFAALVFAIVCTAATLSVTAQQQGTTTRYVYDENGRLHAVISPTGEAVVYEYDAAGNITSIQRLAADALALFAFSPHEGLPGDHVTFVGTGFGDGVSNVSFNGVSAEVISVAPSVVVAAVPEGATTGLVTITTPRGSVSTATPFTIAGLRVTPSFARIDFGQTGQFTAQVFPSTLDQTVVWSVNGIDGGNSTVGTISAAGIYTAPTSETPPVTIRATSVVDSLRFGEAQVQVRDPNNLQSAFASAVAVQYGSVSTSQGIVTAPVAVQFGDKDSLQGALARPVAVHYGNSSVAGIAISRAVSVQRGGGSTQSAALTPPVAVQYGNEAGQGTFYSAAVSATTGPHITSISPAGVSRGATVTVTFSGVNLFGATNLRFINSSGAIDTTSIVATNLSVSADGTTLTATLTVSSSAALGSRVVVVATPNGDSMFINVGTNVIQIVSP
ncbi:MAG TPA: RHS repeat domain-containing protein [Pyrinomonadaceae bacterium]|nr:RHS repeat domain-containing protein [Pyrinomonadaceae bacterium]